MIWFGFVCSVWVCVILSYREKFRVVLWTISWSIDRDLSNYSAILCDLFYRLISCDLLWYCEDYVYCFVISSIWLVYWVIYRDFKWNLATSRDFHLLCVISCDFSWVKWGFRVVLCHFCCGLSIFCFGSCCCVRAVFENKCCKSCISPFPALH